MGTKLRTILPVLLLAFLAGTTGLAARNIQNEVETFLQSVKTLEQEPFGKNAKDIRNKAFRWVIETDKVSVTACSLFVSGIEDKYKYSGDVVVQYTLGMAAYKLTNPNAEENAVQQGGVDSALISYEAMLKAQPKARSAFMDSLLTKRADGSLSAYVIQNNCKTKN